MARIAQSSIEQVQATVDMVDLVGQYTQLRKAGANYSGRCPFHEERTPSFSVNPIEKLYYCFGCGAGGNLFGFVQAKENLDFAAAVEFLADRYGIALQYEETSARGEAQRRRRERVRGVLEQATAFYERILWEAKAAAAAREYLAGRGLSEETCRSFRVGYSLPGWQAMGDRARRAQAKYSDQELLDAGLVVPGKRGGAPYDRFRGRIMFPLADDRGRTLGFGARTLGDEKPKYLNSPEGLVYHKSEALFALDKAKLPAAREDRVFIVEGYTDVLALVQVGVVNVVASMGTSLTEQQLQRLSRLTKNLYLCFDADVAGISAMSRALTIGRRLGLSLHVVRIPDGLDPADYVLSGAGAEGFRELVARAQTLLQFRVQLALVSADPATVAGRERIFRDLRPLMSQASELEVGELVRQVASGLQLTEENVTSLLKSARRGSSGQRRVAAAGTYEQAVGRRENGDEPPASRLAGGRYELEVRFLAACLARPRDGREVLAGVDESFFAGPETRAAYRCVRLRLLADAGGQDAEGVGATCASAAESDDDGGETYAEISIRAGRERFSAAVMRELFLRLQEAKVARLIARLKASGQATGAAAASAELAQLYVVRQELLAAIRAAPVDESAG